MLSDNLHVANGPSFSLWRPIDLLFWDVNTFSNKLFQSKPGAFGVGLCNRCMDKCGHTILHVPPLVLFMDKKPGSNRPTHLI